MGRTRREIIERHLLSQDADVDGAVRRVLRINRRGRASHGEGGIGVDVVREWFGHFIEHPKEVLVITVQLPPGSVREDDEVYAFMHMAHEKGASVVVAAGDYGDGVDTLNPLALSPWVMSVGAASLDGGTLADFSSRGRPSGDFDAPTFVAPGIDVIDGWPEGEPKSDMRESRDREKVTAERLYEQNGRAMRLDPSDLRTLTAVSGTDCAASLLSGIVARLIQMRRKLGLSTRPPHIKEVMRRIATPMPGYESHEVGAGFIGVLTVQDYFDSLDASEGGGADALWGGARGLGKLWKECQGEGVEIAFFSPKVPKPEPGQRVGVSADGLVTEFSNAEEPAEKARRELYLPAPHPKADPERAARLNIEYQEELKRWKAYPWWKRLVMKKPVPPEQSMFE